MYPKDPYLQKGEAIWLFEKMLEIESNNTVGSPEITKVKGYGHRRGSNTSRTVPFRPRRSASRSLDGLPEARGGTGRTGRRGVTSLTTTATVIA